MTRPRLLDLFCCAGGAGMGYHRAGFDVVGVDIKPQPRYPFGFIQADCLALDMDFVQSFDAIHASPPCQAHSTMKSMHNAAAHDDLIPATRALLIASGLPYIIENVEGARAHLRQPVLLCGSMFGLGVDDAGLRRHRLFETSFFVMTPLPCDHVQPRTIGIYGEGCRDSRRKFDKTIPEFTVHDGRNAMECDWMTLADLCQAIPPRYTEFLGRQMLDHLQDSDRSVAA